MRSNPIGQTIFFTSDKYRMTNQKPDTIFFTSEKSRVGFFPAFRGGHAKKLRLNVCNVSRRPEKWLQGLQISI